MASTDSIQPVGVGLDVAILGPLRIRKDGRPVSAGPWKQQIVLALLLCRPNLPVPLESMMEALWPDRQPRTARKNIQVYVSALRQLLGPAGTGERITHEAGGYVLHIDVDELDSLRFGCQARLGRDCMAVGQAAEVARRFATALDLWRGPVLAGMADVAPVEEAADRLTRQHLAVFEDWAEAEVTAGGAPRVVERIAEVVAQHPFRERLHMIQMTALAQAGRRAEALAVYDELRQSLSRELGISPSEAVRLVYESLLDEERAERVSGRVPAAFCCRLPRDSPLFTGRAAVADQLREALTSAHERLAVVSGPTGVGKTALAVHAAHGLARSFPDGCIFVAMRADDGAPRPLTEILGELAGTIGLPRRPGREAVDAQAWLQWLAAHRGLVVLDDAPCESLVRPLLPAAGDSAVIITTRGRLPGIGPAFRAPLSPLALPDALELLGAIVGPARVAADPAAAERIVAVGGRLPLTIRLAGERLALLRHVPLREYAARLDSPSALLDELAAGDDMLRNKLAGAVRDLPSAVRQAVFLLGTLPRPVFTLAEAAAALGADEVSAMRVLETLLAANHLSTPDEEVVAHEVIYEMPVLTRAHVHATAA